MINITVTFTSSKIKHNQDSHYLTTLGHRFKIIIR